MTGKTADPVIDHAAPPSAVTPLDRPHNPTSSDPVSSDPQTSQPATTEQVVPETDSAFSPLRVPIYRAFWLASLVSNLGTWVHEIGAGWLMTSLDSSPQMVAAVRVAMATPMMLLAIPMGVFADRIDRRRLLIITQVLLFCTTATLASLTFTAVITAWSLLALTFVVGLGMVMHVLTWQSTIPELVPPSQLFRAVALGSISFNLARAVGPALGGVLIAMAGPWIAFAVNAMSFAGVLGVLLCWRRDRTESAGGVNYRTALCQGIRYVSGQRTMRNVLVRLSLFMMPASSLWALLPLVARERLGWGADGFGLLVTAIGSGAVVAAWALHRMQQRLGLDRVIVITMTIFAAGLFGLTATTLGPVAVLATFILGGAWMMTLTTLNSTAQVTLPNHLRARGMSCYITVMAISMSLGSLIWGQVAGQIGLPGAQSLAAVVLLFAALLSARFPLDPNHT